MATLGTVIESPSVRSRAARALGVSVLAFLALGHLAAAQIPGVVDVSTLSGADLGEKLSACIQIFRQEQAASNHAGGTCDATKIAGGSIEQRILVDVDNLRITLGVGTIAIVGDATMPSGFLLRGHNVILEGQGPATHLNADEFFQSDVFAAPIRIDGLVSPMTQEVTRMENVVVQNLGVSGDGDRFAAGVWARRVNGLRIRHLLIEQSRELGPDEEQDETSSAIVVSEARDVDVSDNTIRDLYNSGIRINGNVEYARVRGNFVENVGEVADNADPVSLVDAGSGAIALSGAPGAVAPRFVRITDNSMTLNSSGVRASIDESGGQPRDYLISGNTITESRPLATIEGEGIGSGGRQPQIVGNRITEGRVNGILLWSGFIENVAVLGNLVSNVGKDPLTAGHQAINFNSMEPGGVPPEQTVVWANMAFDDQTTQTMNYLLGFNAAYPAPVEALGASNVGTGFGMRAIAPQFNMILFQEGNRPDAECSSSRP